MFLSQRYIADLLEKYDLNKAKPVNTPMLLSLRMSEMGGEQFKNPTLLQEHGGIFSVP